MLEMKAFGYPGDNEPHLRPSYGALNIAGNRFGNCCAYVCYGKSFFGLNNDLLPRITIAQCDTGRWENDRSLKLYTAENAMMVLTHFCSREWHLLIRRHMLVLGLLERIGSERKERWEAICRNGLEINGPDEAEHPCSHGEGTDGEDVVENRNYRELGIHGGWNWKNVNDVSTLGSVATLKRAGRMRRCISKT